ncbi:hypothetical protein C5167_015176 [Papaver somniferum]|uniref:Uncharacterized protein n=1 Tax=Papaver somniferum TaxID=3469 RepID=A0A4Y7J8Q9_PAPSO|nr:hypothetical protein C5167_015176 [Papaver somniferum]
MGLVQNDNGTTDNDLGGSEIVAGDVAANGRKETDAELYMVTLVKGSAIAVAEMHMSCRFAQDRVSVGVVRSCWCIEGGVVELRHVAAAAGNGYCAEVAVECDCKAGDRQEEAIRATKLQVVNSVSEMRLIKLHEVLGAGLLVMERLQVQF